MERNTHDRAHRPQLCIQYSNVSRPNHLGSLKSFPPVPILYHGCPMESECTNPTTYRVYTLLNPERRRYIGITDDVERRLTQHNQGVSNWTRGRGPWLVEWISTPRSLGEARTLENIMKRQKGGAGLDELMRLHGSSGS